MCAGVACTRPRVTSSARERDPDVGAEVAVASRKVGACVDRRAVTRFQVAHFNDLQARYSDRIDGKSRYGYLAGYLRALKAEEPRTLVLDAGDDYEKGAVAELRSMGESTRQMIQALPIDARTLGNHDFAYGEAAVLRDVTRSAHPVLSSNMAYEGAGRPPFASIARFDVGCVRVGVIGLTTHNFGADDQPSREPFAGVFRPDLRYVEVARALVARVRDRVDVLVSLDHIGLEADLELARRVPGIDLIVGGHSEDLLAEPRAIVRDDGSRAWVVQAGRWGRTLGKLELSFDPATRALAVEGYRIVDVNATLPYAVDVGELAEGLERQSAPDAHEVIGQVNREVPRASRCRASSTARCASAGGPMRSSSGAMSSGSASVRGRSRSKRSTRRCSWRSSPRGRRDSRRSTWRRCRGGSSRRCARGWRAALRSRSSARRRSRPSGATASSSRNASPFTRAWPSRRATGCRRPSSAAR